MSDSKRKELEKELVEREVEFDIEEEKKLDDYNSFVDNAEHEVHEDIDVVMRKYDRESNVRVWAGKPKVVVSLILGAFSLWCIYVTLFATFLEEIRLTSFMGLVVLMGFLIYPIKKGEQKVNHLPFYDIIMMILGSAAFF